MHALLLPAGRPRMQVIVAPVRAPAQRSFLDCNQLRSSGSADYRPPHHSGSLQTGADLPLVCVVELLLTVDVLPFPHSQILAIDYI